MEGMVTLRALVFDGGGKKVGALRTRNTRVVAEDCNRTWVETEVNGLEYARGKFRQEVSGMSWSGQDPDFLPLIIAYGPSHPSIGTWDFTHAVKFRTDGKHPNYGFVMYSVEYRDIMFVCMRNAREPSNRPAMMVGYEPKP
jgi:hypothetical protein